MNTGDARSQLNDQLQKAGLAPLDGQTADRFQSYLSLFIRWNQRLNLSAVRDEEGIISRHFIESMVVARELPSGVATVLDFGSGGGLPGIPIAICRPNVVVTLAESQGKKAAFLQEAVRMLGIKAKVHADRAETLRAVFDCVTLRAVEKMPRAVASAAKLVAPRGWLALLTTDSDLTDLQTAAGTEFRWGSPLRLSGSDSRILALGQRMDTEPL